ncbi:hypothetical protein, partial [Kitasatospora sp. DSM 101779]|uniref:hypothetical protein n=1 Tax=Kitasatospora sp. DSM 101779 TaxID=2853165 RepID=UPI0021DAA216
MSDEAGHYGGDATQSKEPDTSGDRFLVNSAWIRAAMPGGPEIENFVEFGVVPGFFVSEVLGGARGAVDFTRSAQLSGVFPDGPSGVLRGRGRARCGPRAAGRR